MKITVLISTLLIAQVSASFFDVFQGAVLSVQNSFGKLFSDVVTDVKDTVDCTILAVEHVLSLSEDATARYYEKCGNSAKNGTANNPQQQEGPTFEISITNNEENLMKEIPEEIDAKINETLTKFLNGYNAHDKLEDVERALAKETERLAEVSNLVKQELDKLSKELHFDFQNLERNDSKPSVDHILEELKILEAIERNIKNSSEANSIHQVIDTILNKLNEIEASESKENNKVEGILKDLENKSNNTYTDLRHQLVDWKQEEARHLNAIQNKLEEHKITPKHLEFVQTNELNGKQENLPHDIFGNNYNSTTDINDSMLSTSQPKQGIDLIKSTINMTTEATSPGLSMPSTTQKSILSTMEIVTVTPASSSNIIINTTNTVAKSKESISTESITPDPMTSTEKVVSLAPTPNSAPTQSLDIANDTVTSSTPGTSMTSKATITVSNNLKIETATETSKINTTPAVPYEKTEPTLLKVTGSEVMNLSTTESEITPGTVQLKTPLEVVSQQSSKNSSQINDALETTTSIIITTSSYGNENKLEESSTPANMAPVSSTSPPSTTLISETHITMESQAETVSTKSLETETSSAETTTEFTSSPSPVESTTMKITTPFTETTVIDKNVLTTSPPEKSTIKISTEESSTNQNLLENVSRIVEETTSSTTSKATSTLSPVESTTMKITTPLTETTVIVKDVLTTSPPEISTNKISTENPSTNLLENVPRIIEETTSTTTTSKATSTQSPVETTTIKITTPFTETTVIDKNVLTTSPPEISSNKISTENPSTNLLENVPRIIEETTSTTTKSKATSTLSPVESTTMKITTPLTETTVIVKDVLTTSPPEISTNKISTENPSTNLLENVPRIIDETTSTTTTSKATSTLSPVETTTIKITTPFTKTTVIDKNVLTTSLPERSTNKISTEKPSTNQNLLEHAPIIIVETTGTPQPASESTHSSAVTENHTTLKPSSHKPTVPVPSLDAFLKFIDRMATTSTTVPPRRLTTDGTIKATPINTVFHAPLTLLPLKSVSPSKTMPPAGVLSPPQIPILPLNQYNEPLPYARNNNPLSRMNRALPPPPRLMPPHYGNPPSIQPPDNVNRPPDFNRPPYDRPFGLTTNRPSTTPKTNNFDDSDYDSFFHIPAKDTDAHNRAVREARKLIEESKLAHQVIDSILNKKKQGISAFNLPKSLKFGK